MISITNFLILGSIILIILFFVTIGIIIRHQNIKKRENIVKNFESYIALLTYNMEKAYDIIHKDQILIYSLEATGIPEENFNNASHSFSRLTIKLMGPFLYKEIRNLYGDDDTLLFNMSEYFSSKYEADEIRSTALENLSSDEDIG